MISKIDACISSVDILMSVGFMKTNDRDMLRAYCIFQNQYNTAVVYSFKRHEVDI